MLYLGVSDVLSVLGYMLAFALLESCALALLLALLSAVLPGSWLRQGFGYKATLALLVAGIASIALQNARGHNFPLPPVVCGTVLLGFLTWLPLALWLHRQERPRKAVTGFMERFAVFSYVYFPLGLVGMLVVLIRNLR